jgi:DNA-nicking Smr family endonuclease
MTDITDEDKALWRATMGETEPDAQEEESFADLLDQAPQEKKSQDKTDLKKTLDPRKTKTQRHHAEPLDKSIERKLKQGKIEPESTLDLHGLTQQEAHAKLNRFIDDAYHRGKRYILVITGKGKGRARAEDWITPGQGVLKQKLPQWIKEKPLMDLVIDSIPCHAKHGGSGAYYLALKKKK